MSTQDVIALHREMTEDYQPKAAILRAALPIMVFLAVCIMWVVLAALSRQDDAADRIGCDPVISSSARFHFSP